MIGAILAVGFWGFLIVWGVACEIRHFWERRTRRHREQLARLEAEVDEIRERQEAVNAERFGAWLSPEDVRDLRSELQAIRSLPAFEPRRELRG